MKRVKSMKQVNIRQSMLLAGLVLASVGAQASVTLSAIDPPTLNFNQYSGSIINQTPNFIIFPPISFLNTPSASSSVSGSMYYYSGTGSGNFSENDSSPDGSTVALDLNRKGYGYHAEASAQTGHARARAETTWITGSGYSSSSASASSTWSDWFVISGGTGTATASFASDLNGVLASSTNASAGYSLNISYSTGAYCYWWYNACGEADMDQSLFSQTSSLSGKGKSTLSQKVEGEFTFAYDKAFQLTATLTTNAANGGMVDLTLESLGNSLKLPQGASLLSTSGMYIQAVPEPETYGMMLAGLGLVCLTARRRRML